MLETNQSIAAFLQMCEEYGLGLDFDQRLPRLLNAVTLEQVRAAAAEVLDPAPRGYRDRRPRVRSTCYPCFASAVHRLRAALVFFRADVLFADGA